MKNLGENLKVGIVSKYYLTAGQGIASVVSLSQLDDSDERFSKLLADGRATDHSTVS